MKDGNANVKVIKTLWSTPICVKSVLDLCKAGASSEEVQAELLRVLTLHGHDKPTRVFFTNEKGEREEHIYGKTTSRYQRRVAAREDVD